jgi:hypothetical protein
VLAGRQEYQQYLVETGEVAPIGAGEEVVPAMAEEEEPELMPEDMFIDVDMIDFDEPAED